MFMRRFWVVPNSHCFLVFFRIQCATLSDHDSQSSSEHNDDHTAFIDARAVWVVPVGDMVVEVVVDFVVGVIFEELVGLKVVNLANALIVAIVIIL